MNGERKPPFDPKAFLSKVSGGRAISDYRKDQNVYTQGEPATKFLTSHATRASFRFPFWTMTDFRLRRGIRHPANYFVAPSRGFVCAV